MLTAIAVRPGIVTAADADEIVMIVHRENAHPVDRSFVQRVYTGALRGWPDGSPVFALDLAERDPTRLDFLKDVIGRSAATMKAIWSQNIFTGKGYPPRQAEPADEMKKLVASNKNAIGYVRASQADDSVRVIRL